MLRKFVVDSWYRKSFWLFILIPFSWCYRLIVFLRKTLYKKGFFKTKKFDVPIIVVGNLTVGGTGKTPLVISLVELFKSQGLKPGVISRGYGGKIQKKPIFIDKNSDPNIVGDETVLIAQRTHVPVVISTSRVKAVEKLLADTDCDIVISDDGLQHLALERDIEIIVIDGSRRFGNNKCLPAGPLRESLSRLKKADFFVCNGFAQKGEYTMHLEVDSLYNLKTKVNSEILELPQPIYAVAGIGNPERFFQTLKDFQCEFIPKPFPDHHKFTIQDLTFKNKYPIVMTEKDAIKCKNFAQENHWVLKVNAVPDEKFLSNITAKALSRIKNTSPLKQ